MPARQALLRWRGAPGAGGSALNASAGSAGFSASSAGQGGTAGSTNGGGVAGTSAAGASGAAGSGGSGGEAPTLTLMRSFTDSGANRSSRTGKLNIGQEFTVTGSSVHVRDLGVWDFGSNGLASSHVVALFALSKLRLNPVVGATPVAGCSVTVPAGSGAALDSGFRFAPLAQEVELHPATMPSSPTA